jgi:hypothetical protein
METLPAEELVHRFLSKTTCIHLIHLMENAFDQLVISAEDVFDELEELLCRPSWLSALDILLDDEAVGLLEGVFDGEVLRNDFRS